MPRRGRCRRGALYQRHEVAVHTVSHPNLTLCEKDEILRQVNNDYRSLTELSGQEIFGMAYPCGGDCYNDFVIRTVLENTPIRYARTAWAHHTFSLPENFMTWHPTCVVHDPKLFKLAEQFISSTAQETDLLFYVWGHSFEFDKEDTWREFEKFCQKIGNRQDISYMTNSEAYRYLTGKQPTRPARLVSHVLPRPLSNVRLEHIECVSFQIRWSDCNGLLHDADKPCGKSCSRNQQCSVEKYEFYIILILLLEKAGGDVPFGFV